ncbi:hypothetical protein NDU88_003932 [Pleurodeles waltl]|uniref:Uncharacterized protein n=1 Tax=Pleurodeles waltl TaxID=8319 RepID=A0AAV7PIA4_PLEWA|nr:hypothetical protein NDU88_003932 [Pleurodeles waltl]
MTSPPCQQEMLVTTLSRHPQHSAVPFVLPRREQTEALSRSQICNLANLDFLNTGGHKFIPREDQQEPYDVQHDAVLCGACDARGLICSSREQHRHYERYSQRKHRFNRHRSSLTSQHRRSAHRTFSK